MNKMKRLHIAASPTYSKSDYIEFADEDDLGISDSTKIFTSHKFPQYLATFIANIGAFALGNAIGWSAPSLPNIEERGDFDNLQADSDMATWIGAMTPLGCFFSGFVAGFLIDKIGRKITMLAMALPFVVGWLLIAFAPNAPCVLAGRFITGFCGGSFTLAVPVYASEIAEDSIRGILSNSMALAVNAGILFTYVVGTLVSWSTSSIINAFLPALFFIGMIFMPESPLYLISKGKIPAAVKSLMWLRGASDYDEVEGEMKSIEANIDSHFNSLTLKDLMAPSVRKPAVICLLLMFFQQFGGINGVIFYSVDIFKDAGTQLDDHLSAIILAIVEVAVVILSTLTVERLGRRILLIVSEVGITISLLALGTYFYIKEKHPDQAPGLGWLPLTSLIVFVLTFNFGMEPVPWTMMGELPPSHAKGLISSLTTAFSWGLAFVITKFFKNLITALTAYGCYWGFSACSFIGLIYCIIFVPETKGKSATEIRQYFEK